MCNKFLKLYRV